MEFSRFLHRLLLVFWLLAVTFPIIGVFLGALGFIFGGAGDLAAKSFFLCSAKIFFVLWAAVLWGLILFLAAERLLKRSN